VAQTAVIDLRNRSVARGAEPNLSEPPFKVSRKATRWIIYLPLGSSEGPYDLRLLPPSAKPLLESASTAKLANGVAVLDIAVSVSWRPPGQYVLELDRNGSREGSYAVELQ
jgi:hypothetical protein